MAKLVFALRDAAWLSADRAVAWVRVLAVLSVAAVLALVVATQFGTRPDPFGHPLGTDFVSFWTAAKQTLGGSSAAAWDPAAHAAAERMQFPPGAGFLKADYAFFYPPPFLLICLPLALLPFGAALAVWLAGTGTAAFLVLRAWLPRRWPALLLFLAFPGTLVNAGHGQNGALSTALLGGAALGLDERPRLAGICLGALCYKPQLALLVVPALIAARRWRPLAWAVMTGGVLCAGSWLVLGVPAWRGFFADSHLATATLELGWVGFAKMVSTFAAARLLGADVAGAWIAQGCLSLAALAAVLAVARCRPGARAEGATLIVATCLATPFLLDYDLMLLGIPLAWLVAEAEHGGYLPWEKITVAFAFLLPLAARPLAMGTGLPVAPLVLTALLWAVVRRAHALKSSAGLNAAARRPFVRNDAPRAESVRTGHEAEGFS